MEQRYTTLDIRLGLFKLTPEQERVIVEKVIPILAIGLRRVLDQEAAAKRECGNDTKCAGAGAYSGEFDEVGRPQTLHNVTGVTRNDIITGR